MLHTIIIVLLLLLLLLFLFNGNGVVKAVMVLVARVLVGHLVLITMSPCVHTLLVWIGNG